MSNSMRDYTPGVGSYKIEEGGSIRGVGASDNVDHQMGTLTFTRQDISVDAPGVRLSLSSRFNSDHLYSTLIKYIASGTQPVKTLTTVPEGASAMYRIAHGWSWDLPSIRFGVKNVFRITLGGTTYDLSSILDDTVLESATGEVWADGFHLKRGAYHDTNYKHLTIAIMEAKVIVECEVLRSGSVDYDYTIVNSATAPASLVKVYGADGTVTTFDETTGFVKTVTDAAGKNTLSYTFSSSSSSYAGTVQPSYIPTRSRFALESADHAVVSVGDLITVRDNTRVVWEKRTDDTVIFSGGLDFIPIASADTYVIGSAKLSTIAHTDGRAVKFYYYGSGDESYVVTLLSSDANREHLNTGDIFLSRYTLDANYRLVRYEVLDTVASGQPVSDFDTGSARLGQVPDSTYFVPLQKNEYLYSLTSEPDPTTDRIVATNHAAAPTTFFFQKGGFRAHSYNQKNIFTGIVRKRTNSDKLILEKPDNIIRVGYWVGISRPKYETAVLRAPTEEEIESGDAEWVSHDQVVDHYDAASDFVTISALRGTNSFKLSSDLTVPPAKDDECLIVDDAFVRDERSTILDTSETNPTRVYMDTVNAVLGDFIAIRNEVRRIVAKGTEDGVAFVDVDRRFSFLPQYSTGYESILLINGDAGTNDFFVYYLNKPKVVKVTYKQSYDDPQWKSVNYAYVYLKGGNETRDDVNGGGFIYSDVDGPAAVKVTPDSIELVKTLVYSFRESADNSEDFTQEVFTFQYDALKRIMGEKEQRLYRREGAAWVPVGMTVNVLGHPCTNSQYYGVTSAYTYRNTCDYQSVGGVPSDLNWKWYVDYDYDEWGRVIRSRKYADCLPGGQAIVSYTQYVGIGTLNAELDPYARFWGNKYASDYQGIFDAKKCFQVVGATLSKVNSEGLYTEMHNKVDSLLNVVETEVIENTLLSSNDVVYTDVEFRVVDGMTVIDDPEEIYWTIDESQPSNDWGNARFAYSNQFYAYSSRSLVTEYEYDATNNKLLKITKPEGNEVNLTLGTSWKASYVVKDKVELEANLMAESQYRINEYDYDLKGRAIQKSTYLVEDDGSTLYTGGGAYPKAIVELEYDGLDRATEKRGGDSSTTPILAQVYDDDSLIMTVTDYLGFRTKTHYDGLFRPIETESFKPDSNTYRTLDHDEAHDVRIGHTRTSYDVMSGKPFEVTRYTDDAAAGEHRVIGRTSYDKLGRVVRTEQRTTDSAYDGGATFDLVSEQEYRDEENAVVARVYLNNPEGAPEYLQSKAENDWLGRGVAKETAWTGKNGTGATRVTEHFYDYAGNQVRMRLPSGEEYRRLHNSSGKLEKVMYPDGTFSLVNYDKNGRPTRTFDRRLSEVVTAYNKADLPVEVESSDATFGVIERKTLHTHLGPAQITETADAAEILKEEYAYHWTGGPTLVKQTADATARELSATYDAAGNQISLGASSPTGTAWSKTVKIDPQYHPSDPDTDAFNRVMIGTEDTPSKRILTQETDYLGLLAKLKYADGADTDVSEIAYSYDRFLRLRSIVSNDDELDLHLARDFQGNLLTRKEPADGSVVNLSYGYDGMARLLSGEGDSLSYDDLSNLSARGAKAYTYQETEAQANQMRLKSFFDGANTYSYGYDGNGNITSVSSRFTALRYDNLNRLREIEHAGGQVDRYAYDSRGLRFKRTEDATGGTPEVTYTIYVGEVGAIQERYVGGVKTDTRFNLLAGSQVAAQYMKVYGGAETLSFLYTDHLGSRRVVLDDGGAVLDRFSYSAWGEASHPTGSQDELASFTGKEFDGTGLLYFNARYYDPTLGRFLTEDPSRKGAGWYSYANNNPATNMDPTGMMPLELDEGSGGGGSPYGPPQEPPVVPSPVPPPPAPSGPPYLPPQPSPGPNPAPAPTTTPSPAPAATPPQPPGAPPMASPTSTPTGGPPLVVPPPASPQYGPPAPAQSVPVSPATSARPAVSGYEAFAGGEVIGLGALLTYAGGAAAVAGGAAAAVGGGLFAVVGLGMVGVGIDLAEGGGIDKTLAILGRVLGR